MEELRIKNKLNKNAVLIIFQSILLDKCHVIYYEQNSDCLVFISPLPLSLTPEGFALEGRGGSVL